MDPPLKAVLRIIVSILSRLISEAGRNQSFGGREVVVGVERFELPTSCSQSLQQGKTGILGNCVFATFSKNIKQLTYAGCQSEIPLNSSRFRMNRKFCYHSATKFSTVFLICVLRCIFQELGWLQRWSDCEELVGSSDGASWQKCD